jgi:hypothetical protein
MATAPSVGPPPGCLPQPSLCQLPRVVPLRPPGAFLSPPRNSTHPTQPLTPTPALPQLPGALARLAQRGPEQAAGAQLHPPGRAAPGVRRACRVGLALPAPLHPAAACRRPRPQQGPAAQSGRRCRCRCRCCCCWGRPNNAGTPAAAAAEVRVQARWPRAAPCRRRPPTPPPAAAAKPQGRCRPQAAADARPPRPLRSATSRRTSSRTRSPTLQRPRSATTGAPPALESPCCARALRYPRPCGPHSPHPDPAGGRRHCPRHPHRPPPPCPWSRWLARRWRRRVAG